MNWGKTLAATLSIRGFSIEWHIFMKRFLRTTKLPKVIVYLFSCVCRWWLCACLYLHIHDAALTECDEDCNGRRPDTVIGAIYDNLTH